MKSKSNGSSDRESSNGKYEKSGGMNDDSMSGGEDRSRSGSPSRNDNKDKTTMASSTEKVDHDALSIYIGNVDYTATEEELRNTFINCGDIVRVTIIKNMKTGHPKGAAFIEFKDKDGVQAAMGLNGREVKGRPLIVTSKKPRPENRPRDGRQQNFDRRPQRSGPPPFAGGGYSGGGRSQYGGPPTNRGGYYHGGGGGFGQMDRRGPPPMQIDPQMQRMQPNRYDPYRRPDMYDPYNMMRGSAAAPPQQQPYYGGNGGNQHHAGHHEKLGGNGGGNSRGQAGQQRYSQPFSRR